MLTRRVKAYSSSGLVV